MNTGLPIPVHLAVHLLGLTATLGLVSYALALRRRRAPGWHGLAVGGLAFAAMHVASGAMLVDTAPWPIYVRAAGYAAVAVGAAGRLLGGPAVVSVVPGAAHLAAAAAGVMAALAAARGVFGRGRETLPFAGGLLLWSAGDLLAPAHAMPAAALSLTGSVATGLWLLRRTRGSLRWRFVGSFLAVLMVLVIGLASATGFIFSADLQRDQLNKLRDLAGARVDQVQEDWPAELRRVAVPLAGQRLADELAAATDGGVDLQARAASIASFPGVDAVVLFGHDGTVRGSWDGGASAPMRPIDAHTLGGDGVIRAALRGDDSAGLVPIGGGRLLAVGAAPVAPRGSDGQPRLDRQEGVLAVARRVADPRLVAEIRARSGAEATIVVGGVASESTLEPAVAEAVAAALSRNRAPASIDLAGDRHLLASALVIDTDGEAVGTIALSLDAGALADVEDAFTRTLFITALVAMAAAAGLAVIAASRTTRPVRRLTEAAEAVAAGDLDVKVALRRHDEVGRLAGAFDDMTGALAEREEWLRQAAATEAALRSRLEIVTASIGEALFAVDPSGRITTANPAAARLLGLPVDGLLERPVAAVLRGADATGMPLVEGLGGPQTEGAASVRGLVESAGTVTPVAATAAPISGPDGRRLGRVYVLRDIRGEVEVERMKTEFLANISHELRTPLTPIKGYAEVLRARELSPERTVEFAGNIAGAAERLERVIAMLVDFSALEAGRVEVSLEPTCLVAVVDEVVKEQHGRHPHRSLVKLVEPDLPLVQVDVALLRRVLGELLDNAVKFSDGQVSILAKRDGSDTVSVSVCDQGPGIPQEQVERILKDFHQADGSATRRHGGLGLGLSIVQRILDRFDAELKIRSTPDVGTEVTVFLPSMESR